jgi:predicted metal-binding protein
MQKNLYKSQLGFIRDRFVMYENVQAYSISTCPAKVAQVKLFMHTCPSYNSHNCIFRVNTFEEFRLILFEYYTLTFPEKVDTWLSFIKEPFILLWTPIP